LYYDYLAFIKKLWDKERMKCDLYTGKKQPIEPSLNYTMQGGLKCPNKRQTFRLKDNSRLKIKCRKGYKMQTQTKRELEWLC
jgi:hypothetical protein